jgi:ABC-type multidrug transport system fused ATPase/permease subunit
MSRPPDRVRPLSLLRWTLKAEPRQLAAMGATLIGVWLCELSLPFLLGRTVDAAVSRTGGISAIVRLGVIALTIAAVLYVLHTAYLRSEVRLVALGAFRLRQHLYTQILEQSLTFLSNLRKNEAVQRILTDAEVLDSHAIYLLADVPFSLLTVTGAFAVMLWMKPALAVLVLAVLAAVAALADRVARPLGTLERVIQHRWAWLGGRLQECLDAFRLVKTFGRETHALEKLDISSGRLMRAEVNAGYVEARLEPLVQLMETFGFLAVIWYGAALVLFGSLTPGALVAFIAYMELMRDPIRNAGPYYAHYRQSAAVLGRIVGFLRRLAPPVIGGRAVHDGPFDIVLQNIRVAHVNGGRSQLSDVSFSARPGEIIGVTGENGAGKSTLMDVMLGLVAPDDGWVLAGGVPLDDWAPHAWRDATAAVPQDPFLFHATIAENIRYGRPVATDDEVAAVARRAGLDDMLTRLPLGLRTIVGDRGSKLSGGERQLVALARALIRRPHLLILDEPCSALDESALAHTHRALLEGKEGRITFIVTHDSETLADADRVMLVESGRVCWLGGGADSDRIDRNEPLEKSAA